MFKEGRKYSGLDLAALALAARSRE